MWRESGLNAEITASIELDYLHTMYFDWCTYTSTHNSSQAFYVSTTLHCCNVLYLKFGGDSTITLCRPIDAASRYWYKLRGAKWRPFVVSKLSRPINENT